MRKGVLFLVVAILVLWATTPLYAQKPPREEDAAAAMPSSGVSDYVLGVGDKLKVTVFGEDDLSGPRDVSSTGSISMPLIGEVKAAGLTLSKLQAVIEGKLREGYMKDPRVSVEVANYRPIFIVGEVMKPGSYEYVNGMSVITAIALAGGYTYRADKSEISVKRRAGEEKVPEDAPIHPGDVIRVPERFF